VPERDESPGSTPRLLHRLTQQAGWSDSLPDEKRAEIMGDCLQRLARDGIKDRDRNRLLDIILAMENSDVKKARLALDFAKIGATADDELARQKRMREALEQADDSMVGDPNATPRPPGGAVE
jgi:hypothetical protein